MSPQYSTDKDVHFVDKQFRFEHLFGASSALMRFPAYGGHTGGGVVVAQQLAIETAVFISLPFCAQVHLTNLRICARADCEGFDGEQCHSGLLIRAVIQHTVGGNTAACSGYQQIYQSSYFSGSGAGVCVARPA